MNHPLVVLAIGTPIGAGVVVMLQEALHQPYTAMDLLTGVVLALVLWQIKQISGVKADLATITERLRHMPTRDEVGSVVQDRMKHCPVREDITVIQQKLREDK